MIVFSDFDRLEGVQHVNNYILALCPFHDDRNRSLLVYPDGWFTCLGCGRKGSWNTLYSKMKGINVIVRPELDTKWRGPNVKDYDPEELAYIAHEDLMHFPSYGWYLEMRGLAGRIETCHLGYWKGWYTIPIFNNDGNFVDLVMRAAPHVEAGSGMRYWRKGKPALYVPDWHRVNTSPVLFLVYGMFDALTLCELGLPVATAGGTKNLNPAWLEEFRRPIFVVPDQDEEAMGVRHVNSLGWRGKLVTLPYRAGIKDPNDFLKAGRGDELRAALLSAANKVRVRPAENLGVMFPLTETS